MDGAIRKHLILVVFVPLGSIALGNQEDLFHMLEKRLFLFDRVPALLGSGWAVCLSRIELCHSIRTSTPDSAPRGPQLVSRSYQGKESSSVRICSEGSHSLTVATIKFFFSSAART